MKKHKYSKDTTLIFEGSLKITFFSPFKEKTWFLSWVLEGSEAEFKEFEEDYRNILLKKSIKEVGIN